MTDDLNELDAIDDAINHLRIAYEKYFAGIDRMEPVDERKRVKQILRRLQGVQTANTAKRFRIQQAQARMVTFEQHWNRICRQIEEGTYRRDKLRAQKRTTNAPPAAPSAAKSAVTPAHADPSIDKLYNEYSAARRQTGAKPISVDNLAKTIEQQRAALKQKLKCRDVEFQVTVKDGKAILKAIPR